MNDTSKCELKIKNVGNSGLEIDSANYDSSLFIDIEPRNPLNMFLLTDQETTLVVVWIPEDVIILNDVNLVLKTNAVAGDPKVPIFGTSVTPIFDWPDTINFDIVLHNTPKTKTINIPFIVN